MSVAAQRMVCLNIRVTSLILLFLPCRASASGDVNLDKKPVFIIYKYPERVFRTTFHGYAHEFPENQISIIQDA